jgi:hypothetical protein
MSNNREMPTAIHDAIELMLNDHFNDLRSRPGQQTIQHQERSQARIKAFVLIEKYNVDHWGNDKWLTQAKCDHVLEYVNEQFNKRDLASMGEHWTRNWLGDSKKSSGGKTQTSKTNWPCGHCEEITATIIIRHSRQVATAPPKQTKK